MAYRQFCEAIFCTEGAQAVLIVDFRYSEADSELIRRIFYVGCSRANAYLQVALYKDTEEVNDTELMRMLGLS